MRTTTIKFDPLNEKSINSALIQLYHYIHKIERQQKQFIERLAEEGLNAMRVQWTDYVYDGDEPEPDLYCVSRGGKGFELVAHGNAVCFIEFGTGVYYNGGGSYPEALPEGVVGIGQYGHHLGRFDWWRFKGTPGKHGEGIESEMHPGEIITHGNPANMPMYKTAKEVAAAITRIAKEVFV